MRQKKGRQFVATGKGRNGRAADFALGLYSNQNSPDCQTTSVNHFEQVEWGTLTPRQEQTLVAIRSRLGFESFQALKSSIGIDPTTPVIRLSKGEAWRLIAAASERQ